jgi:hypothetical protein
MPYKALTWCDSAGVGFLISFYFFMKRISHSPHKFGSFEMTL